MKAKVLYLSMVLVLLSSLGIAAMPTVSAQAPTSSWGSEIDRDVASFQSVPEALAQSTYPSDLEIKAFAGGFAPWTPLHRIHIYPDGSAVYSRVEPENRSTATWTNFSSFNLTVDQMNVIWDAIVVNNFSSLEQNYSTPAVDGSFAVMNITANGVTHTVITQNIKVVAFDSVVITINDATPGDLDLFYYAIHPQADLPSNSTVMGLATSYTSVKIKDCKITVEICIELYGPAIEKMTQKEKDDFAKKVEKDIEDLWNKGKPRVECVCTWKIKEPGCPVTFDAVVKTRKETDAATEGYHQIRVVNDATKKYPFSYVNGLVKPDGKTKGTGEWMDTASPKVYAHETGHLMGEDDQYIRDPGPDGKLFTDDDTSKPKPNHTNDIMATLKCTAAPMQDSIDNIVKNGGVECPAKCCPESMDIDITLPDYTPIGDTHKAPVRIKTIHNVSSWKAGFRFDPHILEWINFTEGPYLSDVGTTTWTPGTIDNVNGVVTSHNCTLEAGKSQNGTGVLAYVTFRVKNYGKTVINLTDEDGDPCECMVLDPDGNEISLAFVDSEITVWGPGVGERDLPADALEFDAEYPGDTFDVYVNFTAPVDGFNSIGLTDLAPDGWEVQVNETWCWIDGSPASAYYVNALGNKAEIMLAGPFSNGTNISVMYKVTVPTTATPGINEWPYCPDMDEAWLEYYFGEEGPYKSCISGEYQMVVTVPGDLVGETRDVNANELPDVDVRLYLVGPGYLRSDISTPDYINTANVTGMYWLVGNLTRFYELDISDGVMLPGADFTIDLTTPALLAAGYTFDFEGDYGLIPRACTMSYALKSINLWKIGCAANPEYDLDEWKAMDVCTAWLYPS